MTVLLAQACGEFGGAAFGDVGAAQLAVALGQGGTRGRAAQHHVLHLVCGWQQCLQRIGGRLGLRHGEQAQALQREEDR